MSQPVCIQLSHLKEAKWYDFHPDDKVSYMIQFIAMENGLDESNYALLVVDKEGAGQWMREDYPLSFYLDASVRLSLSLSHRHTYTHSLSRCLSFTLSSSSCYAISPLAPLLLCAALCLSLHVRNCSLNISSVCASASCD